MSSGSNQSKAGQEKKRTGPQGTSIITPDDIPAAARDKGVDAGAPSERTPVLIGRSAPFDGRRFALAGERSQIGRRDHNDIVLDHADISWEHAQILRHGGRWWVLNVLSTNGTFVNGEAIHEAELHNGDEVAFGPNRFTFRTAEPGREATTSANGVRRRGWLLAGVVLTTAILVTLLAFAL